MEAYSDTRLDLTRQAIELTKLRNAGSNTELLKHAEKNLASNIFVQVVTRIEEFNERPFIK